MIEKNLDTPESRALLLAEADPRHFDRAAWVLSQSKTSSHNKSSWRKRYGDSQLCKRLRKAVEIIRRKQTERSRSFLDVDAPLSESFRRSTSSWAGGENYFEVVFCKHGEEKIVATSSTAWSANKKWSGTNVFFTLYIAPSDTLVVEDWFYLLHKPTGTKITFKQSRGFTIKTIFHKEKHNGLI